MVEEIIELKGHIIDSLLLTKVLDQILARGAEFEMERIDIGVRRPDPSYARIRLRAAGRKEMDELLAAVKVHGAEIEEKDDAELKTADREGTFPDGFYATTNMRTLVRLGGEWTEAEDQEMDKGIVVDAAKRRAICTPYTVCKRVKRSLWVIRGCGSSHWSVRSAAPSLNSWAATFPRKNPSWL